MEEKDLTSTDIMMSIDEVMESDITSATVTEGVTDTEAYRPVTDGLKSDPVSDFGGDAPSKTGDEPVKADIDVSADDFWADFDTPSAAEDTVTAAPVSRFAPETDVVTAAEPASAPVPEPDATAVAEPEPVRTPSAEAPMEKKDEGYVITVTPDAPDKDILYIGGVTACEIAVAIEHTPVPAPAPSPAPRTVSEATYAPVSDRPPVRTATAMPATSPEHAGGPTPDSVDRVAPAPRPTFGGMRSSDVSDGPYTTHYKTERHSVAEMERYDSFMGAVKREDIPKSRRPLAADPTREMEESHEMLSHAAEGERTPYVMVEKHGRYDVTPKYPDPTGDPKPSKKELKWRKKEAKAEEERELLEFERLSKKNGKMIPKTREEREIEEMESVEEARRLAKRDDERGVGAKEISGAAITSASVAKASFADKEKESEKTPSKPVFKKSEFAKTKKRQCKNDLALIEHRLRDEIRRLEMDTRSGDISFSAKIESGRDKRARGKRRGELTTARERLKAARRFENADNNRYYNLVLTDMDRVKLPRKTSRDEMRALRERLIELLRKRDELNIELVDLYSLSEGGRGGLADGRYKAEMQGRKKAFKRQLPAYRKYENMQISLADKEKIYPLMDERTELYGDLARIAYMLGKERASGAAKHQLKRERRGIKRKLKENQRAIENYEKKALRVASSRREQKRAGIIGWVVLGIVAVAAVLAVVFWNDIYTWFNTTALPKLQEWFAMIMQAVTSGTGTGSTPEA